jgi:hypothetical protein
MHLAGTTQRLSAMVLVGSPLSLQVALRTLGVNILGLGDPHGGDVETGHSDPEWEAICPSVRLSIRQ